MTGEQHRLAYHQHLVPVTSPSEAGDRCDDDATQPPPGLCLLRCCVRLFTTTVARLSLPPFCDDPPIYLRTSFRLHKRKMSDFLAADYDNSSADATLRMLLPLAAASTTIAADGFPRPHTHTHLLPLGQRPLYALPTSVTDRLVQLPPATGHCFHTCGCKVHWCCSCTGRPLTVAPVGQLFTQGPCHSTWTCQSKAAYKSSTASTGNCM